MPHKLPKSVTQSWWDCLHDEEIPFFCFRTLLGWSFLSFLICCFCSAIQCPKDNKWRSPRRAPHVINDVLLALYFRFLRFFSGSTTKKDPPEKKKTVPHTINTAEQPNSNLVNCFSIMIFVRVLWMWPTTFHFNRRPYHAFFSYFFFHAFVNRV